MCRARSSRPCSLARARGSKYLWEFSTAFVLELLGGNVFDEPTNHVVGLDPIGLGVEVGHDAMAQHGGGHGADVVAGGKVATVKHRAGLGAENEILTCSRPRAPVYIV